jgi:hypothetical protein
MSPEALLFDRRRILPLSLAVLLGYVGFLTWLALTRRWLVDADGFPMAGDFVSWWSAGRMAIEGRAPEAYDWILHKQVQVAHAIGRDFQDFFGWHNPPPYFLLVIPFALPPYVAGWLGWVVVTALLFAAALRLVLPGRLVVAALAAPATLVCALVGQNGFLTAALMAACLGLLDRRPWLAGICLGVLTVKPQFGVLFPLFLLAEKRWATFAAASITTVLLALISLLLFGAETWAAFLGSVDKTNQALLAGGASWDKLQSLYALAYRVTGDARSAMAVHMALAGVILLLMVRQWRGTATPARRAAALAAASLLVSPYAYVYDAVVLTTAAAFLVKDGQARGFRPGEKGLVALGCTMPALFVTFGSLATPLGAVLLLALALDRNPRE